MLSVIQRTVLLFACVMCSVVAGADASPEKPNTALHAIAQELIDAGFREKQALTERLTTIEDPNTLKFMQVMVDGDLYYRKDDRVIVINGDDAITSFFTGQEVVLKSKRDIKKISVNNKLRIVLRGGIARLQVFSDDPEQRMQAAVNLLKSADDLDPETLEQALNTEKNTDVNEVLLLVKGIRLLDADTEAQRLEGISLLSGSLYPDVRGALANFQRSAEADGRTTELQAVNEAIEKIESLLTLNSVAENLYFGLALGAVLLLAAIGLAITFGVMGVINMAHGEMIMLGAYTTYVVQQLMPDHIGMSLVVAIPAAFLVSGLVGIAIERGVIRHLYGRPLETLLATFGISLVLQQAVRSVFSPLNREVATPDWMAGTFMINPALELTFNRLYIIIFSLLVLALLALVLKRTLFGLQMRAVTMNRPMASSMGIRTGWVDALTFGLGSGIAGIAGVALSQLTNVGPNMGQAYIIDSFMVVVFGGVGNLWGTLVGAMSLGVVNKLLEPWAGAVVAKILVLIFIILFIQKRPRGLFALKGRAADMG
ncbi:MAG: urea ABC transporter permease subunit UrtB [Pseudomonadota bacterium]|nr:urea ABC transporter permease subunit UrtB [Pseudomonadota bacterium]MEC8524052.1 urea ABC transporter permease subunit UrtB [Pseudomonadota bacterium]